MSRAAGKLASGLGHWDSGYEHLSTAVGLPDANRGSLRESKGSTSGGKTSRQSFREGEVDQGHNVQSVLSLEEKPAFPSTTMLTKAYSGGTLDSRKLKHRGAEGAMSYLNPQRPTTHVSAALQTSQSSLGGRKQASGHSTAAHQQKSSLLYPILPIDSTKTSTSALGVSQSGVPPSTSVTPSPRPRHLHTLNPTANKKEVPQATAIIRGTPRKDGKYSIYQPSPALPPISTLVNTSTTPTIDLVKGDTEDTIASRTPTATIWKEPLFQSTYSRDSKQKKV